MYPMCAKAAVVHTNSVLHSSLLCDRAASAGGVGAPAAVGDALLGRGFLGVAVEAEEIHSAVGEQSGPSPGFLVELRAHFARFSHGAVKFPRHA